MVRFDYIRSDGKTITMDTRMIWTPISDAPFVSGKRYLVCHKGGIPVIGFRYHESPWFCVGGGPDFRNFPPDYWMELPEAPK